MGFTTWPKSNYPQEISVLGYREESYACSVSCPIFSVECLVEVDVISTGLFSICISSWIFEKVAPENLAIFTRKTLKPRFLDRLQSASKPHERESRRKERDRSLNDEKK